MSARHRSHARRLIELVREEGPHEAGWRACRQIYRSARPYLFRLPVERTPLPVLYGWFAVRSAIGTDVSDANPLRLRWVSPDAIGRYHNGPTGEFGTVVDGDWDENSIPFEEHPVYRAISRRFEEGVEWEATELYRTYRRRLEEGDPYWRCTTRSELNDYFDGIDELHRRIREEGYRSQRELLRERPDTAREANSDAPHPALNEIAVNVYRDGGMGKSWSGTHRLSVAKVLDVETIPVVVRTRHADWQAVRNAIRQADSREDLSPEIRAQLDHPDLVGVAPGY